jgi:hypothetical protein
LTTAQSKKAAAAAPDYDAYQSQYIEGLKQVNKSTIDAVNSWVEAVAKLTPKPQLFPAAKDMREAAASWFKFNGELLELQREFALSFVQSVAPLTAQA